MKGSCPRPVEAIYGTLQNENQDENNIYENGHIVIKGQKKPENFLVKLCGRQPSQCLIIVMIASVIIFVLTGSYLLITTGKMKYDS